MPFALHICLTGIVYSSCSSPAHGNLPTPPRSHSSQPGAGGSEMCTPKAQLCSCPWLSQRIHMRSGYSAPLRAKANVDKCKASPLCRWGSHQVLLRVHFQHYLYLFITDILVLPSAVALRDESSMTLKVDLFWSTQVAATRFIWIHLTQTLTSHWLGCSTALPRSGLRRLVHVTSLPDASRSSRFSRSESLH
jgi:hypothetical protein